jgi:hypothetical protein
MGRTVREAGARLHDTHPVAAHEFSERIAAATVIGQTLCDVRERFE